MNIEKIMEEVPEYVSNDAQDAIHALSLSIGLTVCLLLFIALFGVLWVLYNFRRRGDEQS